MIICYNIDMKGECMKKQGFTLLEVLAVVVIIGILASISMPIYTRSIERSRAMEAMSNVKAINDAIYMYHADKEACPTSFKQLVVTLPVASGASLEDNPLAVKFFSFALGEFSSAVNIPGTPCPGVTATRIHGGDYQYSIANPYTLVNGRAASLACIDSNAKGQEICDALGI